MALSECISTFHKLETLHIADMLGTNGNPDLTCTSDLLALFLRRVTAFNAFRHIRLELATFFLPTPADVFPRIFTDVVRAALELGRRTGGGRQDCRRAVT